jgi:hypothetical protein
MKVNISNPCAEKKTLHCINCHSQFMAIRPLVKSIVVSRHFIRDLKNQQERDSIIRDILDCSELEFTELHKFEENIDGNLVFRAKKEGKHIVYGVDKKMRIVFLRVFRNFGEYKKFLDDKKRIRRMLEHV